MIRTNDLLAGADLALRSRLCKIVINTTTLHALVLLSLVSLLGLT